MIVVQMLFLAYSLYIAQKYLLTQTISKEHRLMPVILVMCCLNNFYQVVNCVTHAQDVFMLLEDLLLLQVLFAVIHYKKDFLHFHFPIVMEMLLFLCLLSMDVYLIWDYLIGRQYRFFFWCSIVLFLGIIVIMNVYVTVRVKLNKRERKLGYTLLTAFTLVVITLPTRLLPYPYNMIIMPTAIAIAETLFHHLLQTGLMVDTAYLLQQQMYDTSKIATILLDDEFTFLSSNRIASDLFADEIQAIQKNKSKKKFAEQFQKTLQKYNKEQEIIYHDNFYKQQIIPEYFQDRLRGYILLMIDITKQKKETQLMESLKQDAESATEMKSKFLARMSHDLRSPLHAILGFSEVLMLEHNISETNRSMIVHIKDAGTTLLNLVNAILDFSKLESGRMELERKPYSFGKMIEDLAFQCMITLEGKDVSLIMKVETKFPQMLIGDELRVREILQNLLSNAVKYTKKGSITCRILCEAEESIHKIKVTYIVSDTGVGMTEEQMQNVFDEYTTYVKDQQLESTGLGLHIVKYLTQMMNGDVTVESDGHTGSTFQATFYQDVEDTIYDEPREITKSDLLTQTKDEPNMEVRWMYPEAQILVADDMQVNLVLFQEFVSPWKVHVDTVLNGQQAVDAARAKEYQMIFLDNMMPEMNGIDAIKIIRSFSEVPIFLLTADISEETHRKSEESGVTAFIEKPLKLNILQEIMDKYMDVNYRQGVPEQSKGQYGNQLKIEVVKTFIQEVEQLKPQLEAHWKEENLEDFRIKVHGIKSTAKLVFCNELSEQAEILEMAAKTDNRVFIDSHMKDFMCLVDDNLDALKRELIFLNQQKSTEIHQEEGIQESKESVEEILTVIREGFFQFDLKKIESKLQEMAQKKLSQEEQKLLADLKNDFEQLEYEEGYQRIDCYMKR